MVDQAFRATLRNFSTLFLLVAAITVPLHLIYSVLFDNVIETRELHSVIETFPHARQVRSVGQTQLVHARLGLGVVTLLEVVAIPFLARASRRVLERDRQGEPASVSEALGAMKRGPWPRFAADRLGPLLVAAAVGLAVGFGIEQIGLVLLEFVPDERSYPFFGLMQGVSRAAGAPFFLVTLVMVGTANNRRGPETPTLY